MYCDLDPINNYCWTHGVDIDEGEYIEGSCAIGWAYEDELDDDDTDVCDDDPNEAVVSEENENA